MTITKGSPSPTPSGASQGEQDAVAQFQAAAAAAAPADAGKVYMGMTQYGIPSGADTRTRKNIRELSRIESEPNWLTSDEALGQYFTWTQKQRDDFRAKGLIGGLLSKGAGDLEAYGLWQGLVKQAALYGAQGQQVGPLDILSGYVKGVGPGGSWVRQGDFEVNPITGERRYVGPKFKTTTQTNMNLSDPATARAIATKVFQDLLGRDPGQGEISAYAQALSQSERENPSVTTTTTQFDATTGDATNASSVSSGGMTADGQALLAADEIRKKKEYGATQAATTYMGALESAVGGTG